MDLDQLKLILELVQQHELSELELEHEGLRLRVRRDLAPRAGGAPAATYRAAEITVPQAGLPVPASPLGVGVDAAAEIELAVVKSPIVGTFYRSAEPGAPSFVEVGSTVKKGQVLCIIEAMKLMNEIDSEYDGEVVSVYVENGQPVQYGERLFAIKTK